MARREFSHRNEGRAPLGAARTRLARQGLVALLAGAVAFTCYHATLLPGLDLGDSASFQTGVGSWTLTPRQAYPLYYALGSVFTWMHPGEPARALNLASAIFGALAVALMTLLASRVAGSVGAGLGAGLLLAFSYTFWSQAVTAEVYTLHLLLMGATLWALTEWVASPSRARLLLLYAVYALGFGNHLSMILLAPAIIVTLLARRSAGEGDPLRPAMIAAAALMAAAGALQYAWNFRGLWASLDPPATYAGALAQFWFDVTKQDWRETLVMSVSEQGLRNRPAMYWFDLRQQFGVPGVLLAIAGAIRLAQTTRPLALALALIYGATMLFAWTYNVGDAYIFFLPAHYVTALSAGAGIAALAELSRHRAPATPALVLLLSVAYAGWRGWDTFPAVDRSTDTRAVEILDAFTSGHPQPVVLGMNANWQLQNAVEYYMRQYRPDVPWFTTHELAWLETHSAGLTRFLRSNDEAGRDVILSPDTVSALRAAGQHVPRLRETAAPPLADLVAPLPDATPYVLAVLRPEQSHQVDAAALADAWRVLSAGAGPLPDLQYVVAAGLTGRPPALLHGSHRPFRRGLDLADRRLDIRMESWLPTDTIRRSGFGHVIADRTHLLTIERGVTFLALHPGARPVYRWSLFAPLPRLVSPARVIVDLQ